MTDISMLHPEAQAKAKALIGAAANKGLPIRIVETVRTVAEQDKLYAQGRTIPGNIVTNAKGLNYSSMHQWGVAFDICRNDGKAAFDTSDGFFSKVAAIGKSLGLTWGGDFKSIKGDLGHYQLSNWGDTTAKLRSLYQTPEKFKLTWVTAPKIEYMAHSADYGWAPVYTPIGGAVGRSGKGLEALIIHTGGLQISAAAHISDIGDIPDVTSTGAIQIGNTGKSRSMEAIKLFCPTVPLVYRVHYLGKDWSDYVWNGAWAGTKGKAQAIDKIQIAFGS